MSNNFLLTPSSFGSPYSIKGRVNTFADLPDPNLHNGETWQVLTQTGSFWWKQQPGDYISISGAWQFNGKQSFYARTDEAALVDFTDNTKKINWAADRIGTGQTRIINMPNHDVLFSMATTDYDNVYAQLLATNGKAAIDELVQNFYYTSTNVVYVNKSGSDTRGRVGDRGRPFLTIQAAIDAVTDASEFNPYLIIISAGFYNENIVCKNYVNMTSEGNEFDVIVTSSTGPAVLTGPSKSVRITTMVFILQDPTVDNLMVADLTGGAGDPTSFIQLYLCNFTIRSSNPDIRARFGVVDMGTFSFNQSSMEAQFTNPAAITNDMVMLDIIGATQATISQYAFGVTTLASGSYNIRGIKFNSTGFLVLSTTILQGVIGNPAWTGKFEGLCATNTTALPIFITSSIFAMFGAGAGTGVAFCADSAVGPVIMNIAGTNIFMAGFASNIGAENHYADNLINLDFLPVGSGITFNDTNGPINFNITQDGAFKTNVNIIDVQALIGTPTNQGFREFFNISSSAGWVSGNDLTDNGDGTVDVAIGTGLVRISNDEQASLKSFDLAAVVNLAMIDQSSNYVHVDYNTGNPIVVNQVGGSGITDNENDKYELYEIWREGTTLHITDHRQRAKNVDSQTQQFIYDIQPVWRRNRTGELIIDQSIGVNRYITVTSGVLWSKLVRVIFPAFDSSGTDRFDSYYGNSIAGFTKVPTAQQQWDNLNYDNNNVLTLMAANRYAVLFFFAETDGGVVCVYGRAQYTSQATAAAEVVPPPPDLYGRLRDHAFYIGKLVFQQAGTDALQIIRPYE